MAGAGTTFYENKYHMGLMGDIILQNTKDLILLPLGLIGYFRPTMVHAGGMALRTHWCDYYQR